MIRYLRLAEIQRSIDENLAKMRDVLSYYIDGEITSNNFIEKIDQLVCERNKLFDEKEALEAEEV
jgi:hypothetical protein